MPDADAVRHLRMAWASLGRVAVPGDALRRRGEAGWAVLAQSRRDLPALQWNWRWSRPTSPTSAHWPLTRAPALGSPGAASAHPPAKAGQCRRARDAGRDAQVRGMLRQWCINLNRSKVEPMKAAAKMVRAHLEGILASGIRGAGRRWGSRGRSPLVVF